MFETGSDVDIHNHLLLEKVRNQQPAVEYVSSADMVADGLTGALAGDHFKNLRDFVSVVSIERIFKARELKGLDPDFLESIEASFAGGSTD